MREANWRKKDLQGFNLKSSVQREYSSWVLICGVKLEGFCGQGRWESEGRIGCCL